MAHQTVIKPCKGGLVKFGVTGQSTTVYLEKFQLCISPYQDEKYGKGNRVHNPQQVKGQATGNLRCTVCGFGTGICRH